MKPFLILATIFVLALSACKKPSTEPVVPAAKLPTITVLSVNPVTYNSVEVNAKVVSDGDDPITAAGICWATNVNPTISDNIIVSTILNSAYSAKIENLQLKTAYYFRAYATTKSGTAYSNYVNFSASAVKAIVFIKQATKITLSTATISSFLVPKQSDTKASLEYREGANTSWKSFNLFLALEGKNLNDTIKISLDLSDLKLNTAYRFRMKASNSAGETVSAESKFKTCAVADIDGNLYHEVKIGNQVWLQENLKTTKYANGDAIANVTDPVAWGKLTTGAYCWYNNDSKIGEVYGGLYNFYVGADTRGLISGYHVPTYDEWNALQSDTNPVGWQLRETGTVHWLETFSYITNSTGFTALPNGSFGISSGDNKSTFGDLGEKAWFWSSSLFGPGADCTLIYSQALLQIAGICDQYNGLGIRLIKDAK